MIVLDKFWGGREVYGRELVHHHYGNPLGLQTFSHEIVSMVGGLVHSMKIIVIFN